MSEVVIAPVVRSDGADLIRANRENRGHHRPWTQPFVDQPGFEAWYWRSVNGPNVGLVAREAASGGVVGVITLSEIVAGLFQNAYLGFYGMAGFTGRGLMTEAVRLSTRHAFETVGLHRLEANIQPANARSIALVKRLGFRLEGFSPGYLFIDGAWRDHERWALLAAESAG